MPIVGGNTLLQRGDEPDERVQLVHVRAAAQALAPLAMEHELRADAQKLPGPARLAGRGRRRPLGIAVVADRLLVLTDVPAVMTGFGTDSAAQLRHASLDELAGMSFPAGSMAPKIEGCRQLVAATGGSASIGSQTDAAALLAGTAITRHAAAAREPQAMSARSGK